MRLRDLRVTSFDDAADQLGGRDRITLCSNTRLICRGEHLIVVEYHETDIVQHLSNGEVYLNSGGWRTSTTKQRMNRCLPEGFYVYQKRGVWWVRCGQFPTTDVLFKDGMELIG